MQKIIYLFLIMVISIMFTACLSQPKPQWNNISQTLEDEYMPYLKKGHNTIKGEAFFLQRGGGTVAGAGRKVVLIPATTVGKEWYQKAALNFANRNETPPSINFSKSKRTTIADREGKFMFTDVPYGEYYISTVITWVIGSKMQGGTLTKKIKVSNDAVNNNIILSN